MDDMAATLEEKLDDCTYKTLLVVSFYANFFMYQLNVLQKLGKGLDDIHPFSDTSWVDVVLRESERMLLPDHETAPKTASRIWGFISKFVILDRFLKTLGVAELLPGIEVPRRICSSEHLGTASKVSDS
jgi:hypothetical protein